MNRRSFWSFIQKKSTQQDKKHSVIFLTFHQCANNLYQCNLKFFWVYRAQYLQKLSLFTFSDLNNTENLQMTLFYLYRRNQRKTNKYRFTASLRGRSNLWQYCFCVRRRYFCRWRRNGTPPCGQPHEQLTEDHANPSP